MSTIETMIQRKSGDFWPVVALWNPEGTLLPVRLDDPVQEDALNARTHWASRVSAKNRVLLSRSRQLYRYTVNAPPLVGTVCQGNPEQSAGLGLKAHVHRRVIVLA